MTLPNTSRDDGQKNFKLNEMQDDNVDLAPILQQLEIHV